MNNIKHTTQDLELFQDFLESPEGRRLFVSKHSGNWFLRTNGKELIKAGVLIKMCGRFHIIHPNFVPTLIEILQKKTLQSIEADEDCI